MNQTESVNTSGLDRAEFRESLPFMLGNVSRRLFNAMNTQLMTDGIPLNAKQIPVLMVVYFKEQDEITQQDIANALQKDKAGIQRSIQTLHKDGFLKIEGDLIDKRKNHISLTAAGIFVCEKVQALAVSFNNKIMQHFDENERKLFVSFLNRVAGIIDK